MGGPLTSFDVYKVSVRRQMVMRQYSGPTTAGVAQAPADTLSDAEMRRLYDAEREAAIGNVHFRASRSFSSCSPLCYSSFTGGGSRGAPTSYHFRRAPRALRRRTHVESAPLSV
jgi:hypothetical protein